MSYDYKDRGITQGPECAASNNSRMSADSSRERAADQERRETVVSATRSLKTKDEHRLVRGADLQSGLDETPYAQELK